MGWIVRCRSGLCCSALIFPKEHAAKNALGIGDDGYIWGKLEVQLLGVSAADVKVVPVEEFLGLMNALEDECIPAILAELVESAPSKLVLVGFLHPGMMSEFETGDEVAIGEERRTHTGAESEH